MRLVSKLSIRSGVTTGVMKIRQYVYLGVSSKTMTAAEMESHIGAPPDDVKIKGSRRADPPVPVMHSWRIECHEPGLRVDEQIERVLARIEPVVEGLRTLSRHPAVTIQLQIARFFADERGEEEAFEGGIDDDGGLYERLSGQHQLLGWGLSSDQLGLLVSFNASIDADEYN
jgi:hypothetical protein